LAGIAYNLGWHDLGDAFNGHPLPLPPDGIRMAAALERRCVENLQAQPSHADVAADAPPAAVPPQPAQEQAAGGHQRPGPLGLQLDDQEHKAYRNDACAEFGGRELCWRTFVALCRYHPNHCPALELFKAAWPDGSPSELDNVRVQVTHARRLLKPISLTIRYTKGLGYKLEEAASDPPAPKPSVGRRRRRTR
jgi:hypothetical protein